MRENRTLEPVSTIEALAVLRDYPEFRQLLENAKQKQRDWINALQEGKVQPWQYPGFMLDRAN